MVETEGRSSQEGPLRASRWASGTREAQGAGPRAKYATSSHGGAVVACVRNGRRKARATRSRCIRPPRRLADALRRCAAGGSREGP